MNIVENRSIFFDIFKNAEKRVFFDGGRPNQTPHAKKSGYFYNELARDEKTNKGCRTIF